MVRRTTLSPVNGLKPVLRTFGLIIVFLGLPPCAAQKPAVKSDWGEPVNSGEDCRIEVQDNRVTISVLRGPRDLSAELNITNAPRVMRAVEGDFVIQVRVSPDFKLRGRATIEGRPVFCSAGLLLWKSDKDYVRLERAMYVQPRKPVVDYMSFDRRKAGKWVVNRNRPPVRRTLPSWHLRLERRGDVVSAAISEDGADWSNAQEINISDFPKKLLVGVAVCSTSKAPIGATFDSLRITSR